MATHYYDENDLKLLKEMGKLAPHELTPEGSRGNLAPVR
jgi:hypothetical protein